MNPPQSGFDPSQCNIENLGEDAKIITTIGCILLLLIGPILCFYGYRFFKIALFVIGGAPWGVMTYYVTCATASNSIGSVSSSPMLYGVIAFILMGSLMVCCWYFTLWLIGFSLGASTAILLYIAVAAKDGNFNLMSNTATIAQVVALVVGCGCGFVAIKIQKMAIIVLTSVIGSYYALLSISHLAKAENFPSPQALVQGQAGGGGWVAGTVILAVIGVFTQYYKTAKDYDHTKATWKGEKTVLIIQQQQEGLLPVATDNFITQRHNGNDYRTM
jgi:hypothetical protein